MKRLILRTLRLGILLVVGGGAAFLAAGWLRTSVESRTAPPRLVPEVESIASAAALIPAQDLDAAVSALEAEIESLQRGLLAIDRRIMSQTPREPFIVIDSAHNRIWLRHGEKVLREAICSTGSGKLLEDPAGGRSWIFSTPRGVFHVTNRLENPTWRKPDWAFIESGEPVPTADDAVERFEDGVLGEYAMAFGDGFLIHGTLYTRLLGSSVTHGCVRLGPIDLKSIYDQTRLRTPIYIF